MANIIRTLNSSSAYAVRKATALLMKRIHLRPVKKVKFVFDPYMECSASVRDVATVLHFPEVMDTNMGTQFKFDIKSDRTQPSMTVDFNDGEQLEFRTANLSQLEILDFLYEQVDLKDPKKGESPEVLTKSQKGGGKKGGKR